MVTDKIGDLIIRIKNANLKGKDSVSLYASNLKVAVAEALARTGYVGAVKKSDNGKMLEIALAYKADKSSRIENVQRISKPSRRIYKTVPRSSRSRTVSAQRSSRPRKAFSPTKRRSSTRSAEK